MKLLILMLVASSTAFGGRLDKIKKNPNFSIFFELAEKSQLLSELPKRFTLFLPTNDAFSAIGQEQLNSLDQETLKSILRYHIVSKRLKVKKIVKRYQLKTIAGKVLWVYPRNGVATINDANIVTSDIRVKRGRVHVVDKVLIPSEETASNEFDTVSSVDLMRYQGSWYEVARYGNNFQKNCLATRATYGRRGKFITVRNDCQRANGKTRRARALATVANTTTNASLKVSFVPILNRFGLFSGDYNILGLDSEYQWALVGDSDRQTFWILSRTPSISDELFEELTQLATRKGFRRDLIRRSPTWVN